MIGFAVGLLCLFLLLRVLRHGRHRYGASRGCGRGGPPWRRRGGPRSWLLRGLFGRLRTSPEQELELHEAAETLHDEGYRLRQALRASGRELALALRSPDVDEVLLAELFSRHDEALTTARKGFVGAFAQVHLALDEEQRSRLADWLERRAGRGGAAGPGAGPYRSPSPA
jgi:uncharacterized membrane protein